MASEPRRTDPEQDSDMPTLVKKASPASTPRAARPNRVGALSVEKFAPEKLVAGEPFEYEIVVSNGAEQPLESLVLVESLLSLIEIQSATPRAQDGHPKDDAHVRRWRLGPIPPNGRCRLRLRCVARLDMRFRSHTSIAYALES